MLVIVDYRAGNLTSVKLALEALRVEAKITQSPHDILQAERVIFPGVGSAGAAMANLRTLQLDKVLQEIARRGTPFLGICLGAQILFEFLEEDSGVQGLGLLPGAVRRFQPISPHDKIPQIGWNSVNWDAAHPLLEGLTSGSEFYFVHSYYMLPAQSRHVIGTTEYAGIRFASMAGAGNLFATQFHPEKSGRLGLQLLQNFCRWNGKTA